MDFNVSATGSRDSVLSAIDEQIVSQTLPDNEVAGAFWSHVRDIVSSMDSQQAITIMGSCSGTLGGEFHYSLTITAHARAG